jgi:acyl-CoA thioester hydrolase
VQPFRFRFRVRYHECDAQKIVFNARWGDYVDVAVTEYTRALLGTGDPDGTDWKLVRQVLEWKASARYDDVVDASVRTLRVGTTSFTLGTEMRKGDQLLVTAETVYVVTSPDDGRKRPVPDELRAHLEAGAPGVIVDCSGQRA